MMSFVPSFDKRETLAQHISQPESEDSLGQSDRSMGQSFRTYASCRNEEDETEMEFFAIDEAAEFKEEEEQLTKWQEDSDRSFTFLKTTLDEKLEVVQQMRRALEEAELAAAERAWQRAKVEEERKGLEEHFLKIWEE